ncbi:hypothetical protein B0H14DRAFT_2567117 [Mycena olivaceomarginata]|nr:hypothetical protein B0H14DRAFT_2567117 [Mycena olivaceomarginata]
MASRIVSVFGATGTQDGTFTPRAIVRNPDSDAVHNLKAQGVEIVKGDALKKDSLVDALRGSEAVFGVTALILPLKTEGEGPDELVWGKNIVDAAKEVGVKFFIWSRSSVPSVKKISGGKYSNVIHYEQKAAVEEYLQASGLKTRPFTSVASSKTIGSSSAPRFIFPNGDSPPIRRFNLLKKTDTGFNVAVPHFSTADRQAFTWIEQVVPATILALLKNYTDPSKNISGKTYPLVNANISYAELAELTGKVLGVEVTFTTAPAIGIPAMDEMYKSHAEYNVPNPDLVALGVKFGTIQEFLETEVKPRFGYFHGEPNKIFNHYQSLPASSQYSAPRAPKDNAVIQALLKDRNFTPRAIVRNPYSDAARNLKAQGVDCQGQWLGQGIAPKQVFSLTTPIWPLKAEGDGPNELVWGKNIVDAAKVRPKIGLTRLPLSPLTSVKNISGGKYSNVIHYEQKAAVEEYLKASGNTNASFHSSRRLPRKLLEVRRPTIYFPSSSSTSNFLCRFDLLKKTDTGFGIAVSHFRATNYTDPSKNISGKTYPIVNANISYAELAALTGKALGVEVTFMTTPATGMPLMNEMVLHFELESLCKPPDEFLNAIFLNTH